MNRSFEYKGQLNKKMINHNNPTWKGDMAGKIALHGWTRRRIPKPQLCQSCNQKPAYDLANKSGLYKRDLSDWIWLCRKCHMESDGRMGNLKRNPKLSLEEKKKRKKDYYLNIKLDPVKLQAKKEASRRYYQKRSKQCFMRYHPDHETKEEKREKWHH
jgi:hypothetical protein